MASRRTPEEAALSIRDATDAIPIAGCWIWSGYAAPNGYALFGFNGKKIGAHRASYELAYGPIPDGAIVMHRCDNRLCLNPHHLEIGTQRDNVQDMIRKGRSGKPNTRLTDMEVLKIRERRNAGETLQSIAADYGISFGHVWKLANNLNRST